jgi:exosortase
VSSAIHWKVLTAPWRPVALLSLLLWVAFILTLSPDWSLYPQYSYGWFVVPLAGFLLWKRWPDRPTPAPPGFPRLWMVLGLAAVIGLAAGRLLNSANEDWRLAKALGAVSVVGISLAIPYLSGGRPWLVHFGFPILFAMTALPWAKPFEDQLTNRLMPLVAAISVDSLWILKIPALRQGNLIQLNTGMLGVDEACSGIRSLQGTIMAALFLGEYLRLTSFRRVFMLVVGVFFAFACNVGRALILAIIAAKNGIAAVDVWHDSAGLTILLACVVGLWILGLLLASNQRRRKALKALEISMATGMPVHVPVSEAGKVPAFVPPARWVMSCLVAFICLETAREGWFRLHEAGKIYHPLWRMDWKQLPAGNENYEIPKRIAEILGYDSGIAQAWTGEDGLSWIGYGFRWERGNDFIRDVQYHRPDICLPSSGRTLSRAFPIGKFEINGRNLFYKSYTFDEGVMTTHVFQLVSEDQIGETETSMVTEENSRSYRLKRVIQGRREYPGRQVVNLYLRGVGNHREATEAVRRFLQKTVQPIN